MKNTLIASTAILALTLSASTLAAQSPKKLGGFHIDGQLSYNSLDKGTATLDYNSFGGGLALGYDFSVANALLLGVELDSAIIGGTDYTTVIASSLEAKATYSVSPKFALFLKAGMVREVFTDSVNHIDYFDRSDLTGSLGGGVSYKINPNWSVFAAYTHIFGQTLEHRQNNQTDNSAYTFNNVNFGASYTF